MMIYVEVILGEGAVEMVEEGEGVAQIVEEGTGVAETEMGEGGEEPFTFLGAEVNEGEGEGAEGEGAGAEGEGEGVEGDDLVDSDYEGVEGEDEQPEACLTQDQMQPAPVPPLPVFMPGPSMFEQLHMNNPGTTLQSRVTIRAPPPFRGRQILPSFSTRPQTEASEAILKEGRQKFLKLNK
ncbi:UNVERIFIED_CONTAM: hypothetical protein Sindi_0881900 [Sesamum indicum]